MQTGLYIFTLDENTNIISQHLSKIQIFPNPAGKKIWIESNADKIIIYNSVGEVIINEKILSSKHAINTNSFNSGIYFYELMNNHQKLSTGKIIFK